MTGECSTSINCQTSHVVLDTDSEELNERTPLLSIPNAPPRSCLEVCIVSIIFFCGIAIGIYLLIVEGKERPTNFPFDLIDRSSWTANEAHGKPFNQYVVDHVIVFHTRGKRCDNFQDCIKIIKSLQTDLQRRNISDVPYNFLISDDGLTYEAQGWKFQSGFIGLKERNRTFALGFLGNFTKQTPKRRQLEESRSFINEAIRRGKLQSKYGVFVARNKTEQPRDSQALIDSLKIWDSWRGVIEYS
ncbi:peptidoglycan-recognition protein SB1-like isoform X2 [Phlebotomus papatasi]|uniref:peptidoglycan-recognition protein SB1-like isoform X2 n=1 Tax=Phlebotomus papatasi TaxID=29031 RepID=UPI00248368F1|nr:peptidoglycan-recognition protein SB1-like isoform X2 [Phlebotomus papatasi]